MPLQLSPPGGSPPTHPTPRSGAASSCAESSPPSSSASPLDHHLREHAAHHRHIVILLLLLLLLLLAASSVGEGAAGAPCSKKLPITRRTTTPRRCSRERFILPHTSAAFAEGRCLVGRAGGAWGGGGSQRRRTTGESNKQRCVVGGHEIRKRCSARVRQAASFCCGHAAIWSSTFKRRL